MRIKVAWIGVFLLLGVFVNTNPSWSKASEIAIIVAKDWDEAENISSAELKQIYLGRIKSFAGRKVKPAGSSSGSAIHREFSQNFLGMTEDQLKQHWIREKLKGGARPPKSFRKSLFVMAYVAKVKGGIGYVSQKDLSKNVLRRIKIIPIQ